MHNLFTVDEARQVFEFAQGNREYYGANGLSDGAQTKLYEMFLPEMPYGVAKARTGDPDVWIGDRLSQYTDVELRSWLAERTMGNL